MPIPAGDLALLRGRTHIIKPKLNIFPMEVVATATVAAFPSQYPIGSLSITNTNNWNNVKPGQLFRITDINNDIVTYGVVRLPPTSNTLYIDGKSRGDAGYARRLLRAIDAGQTISVFNYEPMWTLLSRIYQGKFYKNYDVPYTDAGSKPSPVCNIGKWRQVDADYITGRGTLTFDNSRSFAWFNAGIVAYSWSLPSTATILSGSTSTSSITISLPAGFHIIRCTLTDGRGKTQTGMRPIWVNHPLLYPPVSDLYGMEIGSDSQDRGGRSVTFKLYGDIPETLFVPGGAILFTEEDIFDGGQHLSENIAINNYAGFMSQEVPHYDLTGQKSIEIETRGPYKRMGDIPMVSQAIIEKASPADWTQIANGFGTVDFVTWYILKHHTTFLDMFDYEPLLETTNPPRKKNWGLNGGTIAEYLEQMGKMVRGNIGSASDGTLYLRRDPTIEENTFRNALDERMTWTEHDILEPVDTTTIILPTVGQIRAFAFAYGTQEELNAVASIAPGFVQGMGPSKQDEESLLVGDPATAQDKINRISGHIYAKLNNPLPEIQIKPNRNMDVADPVRMLWHRIDVSSPLSPQNNRLYMRLLPKGIDRSWENNGGSWIKRLTTTFETESYGQPGETYIVDKGGGSIYPPIDPGTEQQNTGPINFHQFKFIIALDTYGNVAITSNARTYRKINAESVGQVCDLAVDWGSQYITSGFVDGALGMWMTTLDGDKKHIRLYYSPDVLVNNVNWQLAYEIDGIYNDSSDVGVSPSLRVLTYPEDRMHITVVYWDSIGTHAFYTLDGAATFSDVIDFTDTDETDITSRDAYIGADMDADGTLVTSGIAFSGQNYQMLYLPKGGVDADWHFVDESPNANAPMPMIKLNRDQNAGYASSLNKAVTINQQAIINTSTYPVSSPSNCDGSTTGTLIPIRDIQWVVDTPEIDSPICSHVIPVEIQPALDLVFFSSNTYGVRAGDPDDEMDNIDAGEYELNVSMSAVLDGKWDINAVSMDWVIQALAYSNRTAVIFDLTRGGFPYYLTDGDYVDITLTISGANGILYEFSTSDHYTNDLYITDYGGVNYYCIGGVTGGSIKTFGVEGLDIKGATHVSVSIHTKYISRKGMETAMGFDFFETPWHCTMGISSLTINGTTVTKDTPRLWKFSDYKTPPATFTNISPDGIWAPFHPYGLAFDPVITTQMASIQTRGSGTKNTLFTSTNRGLTWTPNGFVKYHGVHKVGNTSIFFGQDKLDIATSGISPVADIRGDWTTSISDTENVTFTRVISAATIT